ncbi:glucose-1-phosphate thymidylyltransferase [Actinomadura cremea]|nr:glucose-1-phosphate thymidylyltransferase [Actinomadura cremea]
MKALVLAGGTASRLRPFSNSLPKQLIPLAGRPVLEHVLRGIADIGVRDTAIVVGDTAPAVMDAIGDGARLGLRVTYVPQARPLGLAHCVTLARSFLGDDDFVMYLGDNLLPGGIADPARRFRARRPSAQLLLRRVADPRAFGVAEVGRGGVVRRLEEKPAHPRTDLAVLGVYFFTAAVHAAIDACRPSHRGELEITDAIQVLIDRGRTVRAVEHTGHWRDIGRPADVLACNRRLLAELRPRTDGELDAATEVTGGPVVVEPGARVIRSRITGPALVGADTVLTDCEVGPDAAIGRDCSLRGVRLRDAVVLDGTSLSGPADVHAALVSPVAAHSVIGPAASGASG